jgi:hypothetical protein
MTTYTITQDQLDTLMRKNDLGYWQVVKSMLQSLTPNSGRQFCYCDDGVSLQMVSGGGAPEGYLGKVTLRIGDQYREYSTHPAPSTKRTGYHASHCYQGEYPDTCKYGDADCTAAPQGETK